MPNYLIISLVFNNNYNNNKLNHNSILQEKKILLHKHHVLGKALVDNITYPKEK